MIRPLLEATALAFLLEDEVFLWAPYDFRVESGCGCGNGKLEGDEECDFGDTIPGDGCDENCKVEGDRWADSWSDFDPMTKNGEPTDFYANPDNITGATDGGGTSLGDGGSIVVHFDDNYLRGDGTTNPDLAVLEIGPQVEWRDVYVLPDGGAWTFVGKLMQQAGYVDIDAFGFGVDSRIHQVRIVDDTNQGDQSGPPVGADIDSVEAVGWPYAP